MRPYYYIHNQNGSTRNDVLPTSPITNISELGIPDGTDMTGNYKVTSNGYTIYRGTAIYRDQLSPFKNFAYIYFEGNYYDVTFMDNMIETSPGGSTKPVELFDPKNPGTPLQDEKLKKAKKNIEESDTTATVCYPDPEDTVGMIKDGKIQTGSNLPRTFKLDFGNTTENISLVEKPIGLRAGNPSNVRMEIRYGKLRFLIFS